MRALITQTGWFVGRSLLPISAIVIILGTILWGPWVSLVLTVVWWKVVTKIG